jgi:fatty-acid peroxygenase
MTGLPHTRSFDSSSDLLREGYRFIGNRCRELGSDAFRTRLMMKKVTCLIGVDAARMFYTPGRFHRRKAMPPTALRLLTDKGSVQQLEGTAHRARKQMFMGLLLGASLEALLATVTQVLGQRMHAWVPGEAVVVQAEMEQVLGRAAMAWLGLDVPDHDKDRRVDEFCAMVEGAGTRPSWTLRGLARRWRTERWLRREVRRTRERPRPARPKSPLDTVAWHVDGDGRLIDARSAAVELVNLVRPILAIARFATFSLLALHDHPRWRERLRVADQGEMQAFVQEVRRFYPFFPAVGGRAMEAFRWRDIVFDRDDWVILDLYGTNHDPRAWPKPDHFDPLRFLVRPDAHENIVAQGSGEFLDSHRCAGEPATIAILVSLLGVLLQDATWTVRPQAMHVPLDRIPTLPVPNLVLTSLRNTR